ncbi:MAG: hypothetical protein ABJC28_07805 [Acidobacteriota bacterium]
MLRWSLEASGAAFTLPDGNRVTFWPARRIPPVAPPEPAASPFLRERVNYSIRTGAVVGVVAFSAPWTDARSQVIPAGTYALRYAIQPAMKEHRGVSAFRDVLVLVAPGDSTGTDLAALAGAGRRVSGTAHPAVMALLPAASSGAPPGFIFTPGTLTLEVRAGRVPLVLGLGGPGAPPPE